MKKILFVTVTLVLTMSLYGQRRQVRPDWLLEKPEAGNSTYEYVIEHGIGLTEAAALEEAVNRIHQNYTRRLGQGIISSQSGVTLQEETFTVPF